MKYFFFAFLITVFAGISFAESIPAKNEYLYGGGSFESTSAACGSFEYNAHEPYSWSGRYYIGDCGYKNSSGGFNSMGAVTLFQTCTGVGGTLVGTIPNKMCECPPGQKPVDGQCKQADPCEAKAGMFDNAGNPQSVQLSGPDGVYTGPAVGGKVPQSICINGCSANPRAGYNYVGATMKDGTYSVQGNPQYSGQSCGANSDVPNYKPVQKNTPEYDCASKGQGFGYVNGSVVCTGATTPNDSKGKTNTNVKTNADGTKTETTVNSTVSCNGAGACTTITTTTTTTINADGTRGPSTVTTDTSTKQGGGDGQGSQLDKSDPFCVQNPNSPMCKSGAFAGSCTSEPACSGDPVQCAVAVASWRTDCKTMSPGTPTDGPAVVEKKIGNQFASSDLPGAGSCPSPRTVSIGPYTIAVEFTPLCEFASALRPVIILLGWIAAAYIVLGRSGVPRG